MKFAFMIMGDFSSKKDHAVIHDGSSCIVGVENIEEACAVAKELQQNGIDCIEVCGAFGEEGTRKLIEATHGTLPIGYVVHLPEQDALYQELFSR